MINIEEYLNNFFKGTKDPSLKAMEFLMDKFNNFEKNMKFIHIAGTNGKGSCTEMISNILLTQGYKVGKFISPHLIRYNERISINGVEISDEEMSNIILELEPYINEYQEKEGIKITLFELETTMALLYFYRNNVDFAVLETGLGGLYDCTNVITKPLASIITSIGYDHMDLLGDTLPKIAYQKAGIIKKDSHTVVFEQEKEVENVFIDECKKKNNTLHIIKEKDILNYSFDENFQYFDYGKFKQIAINLKGKIQVKNASLCIETMKILKEYGYIIDDISIFNGIKSVIHKARMEKLNDEPTIIYDGAHNEPAANNLMEMVNMYYPEKRHIYIISILKRKDYNNMLRIFSKDKDAKYILTSGNDPERYATSEELYNCLKNYTKIENIYKDSLENAIQQAVYKKDSSVYFVVGSFYTYGTVVSKIKELKDDRNKKY